MWKGSSKEMALTILQLYSNLVPELLLDDERLNTVESIDRRLKRIVETIAPFPPRYLASCSKASQHLDSEGDLHLKSPPPFLIHFT